MTIVCRPVGRGNWTPMVIDYPGHAALPLYVEVEKRFQLGGIEWRVVAVLSS